MSSTVSAFLDEEPASAGELPEQAPSSQLTWLVDNKLAYRAVLDAIAGASRSIWITQLAFDADCRAHESAGPRGDEDVALLDALVEASMRGVRVCILLNETFLLDTAAPLRRALAERGAHAIEVRGISRFPQLIHAKMLIADERDALMLGSPFVNGYWDDSHHAPEDERRPARELGGRPLHDLSVGMSGPVVHAFAAVFAELWNEASVGVGERVPVVPCARAAPPSRAVRVVRTAPGALLPRHPAGISEIVGEMERGIARARRSIYIEHQYLSSGRIVSALAAALEREPELEIIAVLNQNPDVTAYRVWQRTRLGAAGLLGHPRVGLFAIWSARPAPAWDLWSVSQVFVHSKVLIVDNAWLTVGSANLDGVSLHGYGNDFKSWLGQRIFRGVRNVDVNIVLDVERGGDPASLLELRETLWREHLAMPSLHVADIAPNGSLALWRRRAADNVLRLSAAPRNSSRAGCSTVLPFSAMATPAAQLHDLGIQAGCVDLEFDPGWLEVHCSPNWIRNMFA